MATVQKEPINSEAVVRRVSHTGAGAILTFAGTVRDHHLGRTVQAIEYHAYEPMARKQLCRIEDAIRERWPGVKVEITHRFGPLAPGETSVLIAVASAHRPEGFDSLRFAIEQIKESVPIWKKELYPDGHAWIEGS